MDDEPRESRWSIPRVRPRSSAMSRCSSPARLGVPVIVGEDRYTAGKFVEEKFGLQAHLLDDGFQHRG